MLLQMAGFLLWLNNISSFMCVPHFYSFINRHIGCFHVIVIVNIINAVMNVEVQIL